MKKKKTILIQEFKKIINKIQKIYGIISLRGLYMSINKFIQTDNDGFGNKYTLEQIQTMCNDE